MSWKTAPLRTLRARLFAFLLGFGVLAALAVGGATYSSVRAEADALFDYHLRQMALSLRDQRRIGEDESAALANPELDFVVQVWSPQGAVLYTSRPPALSHALPERAVLGFSQVRIGGEDWRVFAAATPLRVVQVAQPLAVRGRLATAAAWRSVLPIVLAVPPVALGLWWLIAISLAPVQRLAREAGARGADRLEALPLDRLPGEMEPLVRAFNGLLARLESAFEAQRGFIADAAHELRTPLTALKLQIGLLQGAQPGPELDEAVQRLKAGVDRAGRVVEQLLALARAEPRAGAGLEEIDVAVVARQALADAQPQAQRRGVALELDAPVAVPISGDAQALRGALRNLMDNAANYGAKRAILQVRAFPGGWSACVDDDGPGIPAAQRARVLERFQRAHEGDVAGSGLGLAIARAVARQHGASLRLTGSPLGGLRVVIEARAAARDAARA